MKLFWLHFTSGIIDLKTMRAFFLFFLKIFLLLLIKFSLSNLLREQLPQSGNTYFVRAEKNILVKKKENVFSTCSNSWSVLLKSDSVQGTRSNEPSFIFLNSTDRYKLDIVFAEQQLDFRKKICNLQTPWCLHRNGSNFYLTPDV